MQAIKLSDFCRFVFWGLFVGILPLIVGFSPALLEQIDVVAIRDVQLRQEQGKDVLDTTIVIRNASENALKLENANFQLAFVISDSEEISLGKAAAEQVLLSERPVGDEDGFTDTEVLLSVHLAQKLQILSQTLLTKQEVMALLIDPKSKLNLHFQAKFNLGIKAEQTWAYQPGITLDWVVTPEVQKHVLAKIVYAANSEADTQRMKITIPIEQTSKEETTTEPVIVQETSLRETLTPGEDSSRIVIYFASGSTRLSKEAKQQLQEWALAQHMILDPEEGILYIEGHTDSSGVPVKNREVSVKRAGAVYTYLTQELNMLWGHVVIKGLGESRPAIAGDSAEAQTRNRRAEVYVSIISSIN